MCFISKKTYLIGDLSVGLIGGETTNIIANLPGFKAFEITIQSEVDIEIHTDKEIRPEYMGDKCLLHTYTVYGLDHMLYSFDGGYLFEMRKSAGETTVLVTYNPQTNQLLMSSCNCKVSLRFAVWIAYAFFATGKGVLPIHSSAIVKDSSAVLFLGESGTGKSTHSRLWLEHIKDSFLLNDDSPMLRVMQDGRVLAYGSPWSGKVHCYKQYTTSLKAMVRIHQAPYNKIEGVNIFRAIGAVYPSCPPIFAYDKMLADRMLHTLDRLLRAVLVYKLECLPNEDAARTSYNAIFCSV